VGYRRRDAVYLRAKAAGYRARSAYKLAELDRRFGLLRRGDVVVDLGAWPGGWLQVALERVGPTGRVVGVDLRPVEPLPAPNLELVVGDVRDPAVIATVRRRLGAPADVVLCDLAPKLSGVRATDEAHAEALTDAVLAALPRLLRHGGRLLMKVFMGPSHRSTVERLRDLFEVVRTTRPAATRAGSAETYVACLGFHHQEPCGQPVD
jgi:23S rRNA (uridine2552-2'-O)-methyltransferase